MIRFTKNTTLQKQTYSENAQKIRCNANHRQCAQLIVNQRQRKREIAATLVCLFVQVTQDDQMTSQRFNVKLITFSCVIQDFIR